MKIILASKSRHRRMLFEKLGLKFEIVPSDIDEERIHKLDISLEEKVMKLAEAKAEKVAENCDYNCLIIASDLMVELNGKEFGKPKSQEEALKMLRELSGKLHKILVGTCILNKRTEQKFLDFSSMNVQFRDISDNEINEYIKNNPVTEYAAAYGENSFELFEAKFSGDDLRFGIDPEKLIPILQQNGIKEIMNIDLKE